MRLTNQEGINKDDAEFFKSFKQKIFIGHKKTPTSLDWNLAGNKLVSAESVIKIWNLDEMNGLEKVAEMKANDSMIECAKFYNNQLLGTMSRDLIKFWDIRDNNTVKSIKAQKRFKSDFVAFRWANTQNNPLLALSNKDNVVTIYDYRNFSSPLGIIKPGIEVNDLSWDRSDSVLFIVGGQNNSGLICMYAAPNYQQIPQPLNVHCGRINSISFSPRNTHMATASEDSLLEIHSVPELICQRVYSNKSDNSFKKSSFSYDGKYLAVTSQDPYLDIFNVAKGGQAYRLKCSSSQQNLAWHPKKMVLAYTEEDDKKKSNDKNAEDCSVRLFSP